MLAGLVLVVPGCFWPTTMAEVHGHLVDGRAGQPIAGATVVTRQEAPGFRRLVVERPGESVVVDLVLERAPQIRAKAIRDGIRVDAGDEILANKLTARLARGEVRDLIDVMAHEREGLVVEGALPDAITKEAAAPPRRSHGCLRKSNSRSPRGSRRV
jgi:hypothetical protein